MINILGCKYIGPVWFSCGDGNTENIALVAMAHDIKDKFVKLFSLFDVCHNLYNSSSVVDIDILGNLLIVFMVLFHEYQIIVFVEHVNC